LFHDTNPARTNKICPPGFGFHADNFIISNNSISIDIKLVQNFKELRNIKFTANFVVALSERKPDMEEFSFPYAVALAEYTSILDSEYQNVTAFFNSFERDNVEAYTKAFAFMALTNTERKPYIHSSSFARGMDIIQT
jgi:hypothetical protein